MAQRDKKEEPMELRAGDGALRQPLRLPGEPGDAKPVPELLPRGLRLHVVAGAAAEIADLLLCLLVGVRIGCGPCGGRAFSGGRRAAGPRGGGGGEGEDAGSGGISEPVLELPTTAAWDAIAGPRRARRQDHQVLTAAGDGKDSRPGPAKREKGEREGREGRRGEIEGRAL
ncbi:hypothetical protein ACP4OV_027709 [Aristida adscensionis]